MCFSDFFGCSCENLRFGVGWEGPGRRQLDFLQFSAKSDQRKPNKLPNKALPEMWGLGPFQKGCLMI
jgi:hypothetical protein